MKKLLEQIKKGIQPSKIPIPFSGKFFLIIYWWFYRIFLFRGKKDYEKVIKELDTPLKVQAWLFANIKYTSDKVPQDHWQPAERTFKRKRGDCEDWAIFSNECLKDKYDGYFLCMYTNEIGHASYVIKKSGKKKISIGTFGYMKHEGDWGEIIKDWHGFENWQMYKIKDENLNTIHRVPNVFDW
jgi:hypothetical protein